MKLDFENAIEDIINPIEIENIKKYDGVIIFGAGESGGWSHDLLKEFGCKILCFSDNYEMKWGKRKNGFVIYPFHIALEKYPNAAICIASMWEQDIRNQISQIDEMLLNRTFSLLTSMNWETMNRCYKSKEMDYIRNHYDELSELYDSFEDDISRKTLEGILNYRLTRKKEYISNIKSLEREYFDSTLVDIEAFKGKIIDAGAFDGDSIAELINYTENDIKLDVVAFEMDAKNCEAFLKRNFSEHNIVLIKKALSKNSDDKVRYKSSGLSCCLETDNKCRNACEVISIDEMNLEKISFVKMDIEGAERNALVGGILAIRRDLPVLAICAYHLQDDILALCSLIRRISDEYQLYMRHYLDSTGGTIIYAIRRKK